MEQKSKLTWSRLFANAIAFSLIAGFGTLTLWASSIWGPIITVAVSLASAIVAGNWSVYGLGPFHQRLAVSILFLLMVATGFSISLTFVADPRRPFLFVTGLLLTFPPILLAAQLPHWILRMIFGWQFVRPGQKHAPVFQLKELFVITFFVAISLASVSWSASCLAHATNSFLLPNQQIATPQQLELIQQTINKASRLVWQACLIICIASALCLPLPFLILKIRNLSSGLTTVALLFFGLIVLSLVAAFTIVGGAGFGTLAEILIGGFGCLFGFQLILLVQLRLAGIRLETIRSIRKADQDQSPN